MDAGLAIIAAAGGFLVYKHVKDGEATNSQQQKPAPQPFWNEYMDSGNQPATGNGGPTTDQTGHDVANVIGGLAKFGTSLFNYFGTAQNTQAEGGGVSTGGPTATYSDGGQDW